MLTPQRTRKVVEYFALEQTSIWHFNLALAFLQIEHVEECMTEMLQVLEKEPDHSPAMYMIGYCHMICGNHHRAIAIVGTALELKLTPTVEISYRPTTEKSLKDHIVYLKIIANLKCLLEDFQASIENLKEAFELGPDDLDCADSVLNMMARSHLHAQYLSFVENLDQSPNRNTKHSQMTELLFEYPHQYRYLGLSASIVGRDEFAASILEKAVDAAQEFSNSKIARSQQIVFAEYLRRHEPSRIPEAIVMWTKAIDEYGDDFIIAEDQDEVETKSKLILYLSESLYIRAFGAMTNNDLFGAKEMITMLWKISTVETSGRTSNEEEDEGNLLQLTTNYASMMLGAWYQLIGLEDNARQCFAPKILEGIAILEDDNPDNDLDGYLNLARTLLLANDIENAEAAFTTWALPLHRLKRVRRITKRLKLRPPGDQEVVHVDSATKETEELLQNIRVGNVPLSRLKSPLPVAPSQDPSFDASKSERAYSKISRRTWAEEVDDSTGITGTSFDCECGGLCFRKPEDWKTFGVCATCLDTFFCNKCLALSKEGALPFQKCAPDHCLLQILPVRLSPSERADYKRDGVTYPRPEWLDRLKIQWSGIPETLGPIAEPDTPLPFDFSRLAKPYRIKALPPLEEVSSQPENYHPPPGSFPPSPDSFPPPPDSFPLRPESFHPPPGSLPPPPDSFPPPPESFPPPPG